MRVAIEVYIALGLGITLGATVPGSVSAQVPTVERQPRAAVPAGGAVIQTATPTEAATPAAQPPGQPTAAPAAEPAPVTAVSGPPSGVTQLPTGAAQPTASTSYAATGRSYTAGNFALTLEGTQVGWMQSVEGGGARSDVVVEKPGPDYVSRKHLAGVKYEDISLKTGLDSKLLNDWIAETSKGSYKRKNGSVIAASYDYKTVSELQFSQALITEITFPTLDASSKDPAYITVKIAPELTRLQDGSGATVAGGGNKVAQKRWLPSNFRFKLDGLEAGSSKINRVESFTMGLKLADNPVGEARDYERAPSQLEFPNLKLTLPQSHAQDWVQWHDEFVIKGNNGDDKEKNGSIAYLDASLKELALINLFNCGIFRLAPEKVVAGSENIRRLEAELYCERMEFIPKN